MYPKEYIQYLTHFHGDRDYFECHEILEEYWKEVDTGNKSSIWVGFIQLAVSTYHHRRANFNGAKKTLEKALTIFCSENESISCFGLDPHLFNAVLKKSFSAIKNKKAYKSFDLPISDPTLLNECLRSCDQKGFIWGKESDFSNNDLIHRHKSRDRTNVSKERELALKLRKGND